jgi:hypothetical protein
VGILGRHFIIGFFSPSFGGAMARVYNKMHKSAMHTQTLEIVFHHIHECAAHCEEI